MLLVEKIKKIGFCMVMLTLHHTSFGISLVYNLKIRRSFSLHKILKRENDFLWLVSAVPVIYTRKRHIVVPQLKQNIYEKALLGGSLFNVRCLTPKDWWAELTAGIERQTTKVCGTQQFKASRTGFDDIVLSAGKNFLFKNRGQVGLYGLCGFPTRSKVTPEEAIDPLVGTRFFGAGLGAEISYSFITNLKRALTAIVQTRFVHFFNRKWFPILPCNAKIQPGNVTDLFLLLQYREKKDIFELGYNPTFFTQQAVRLATGKVPSPNFVRNSFYASYTHAFPKSRLIKKPGAIGCGFNISRANMFDTKIAIFWVNFSILF